MLIGKVFKDRFHRSWGFWLRIKYDGVNYGKVLANEIAHNTHKDKAFDFSIKHHIKSIVNKLLFANVFCNYDFVENGLNPEIIFFNEEDGRKDYQEQCSFLEDQLVSIEHYSVLIDKTKRTEKKFRFGAFINKLFIVQKTICLYILERKKSDIDFRNLIFYLDRILYYYDQGDHLDKIINWEGLKLVITFSDMKEYSNIATQIAIKKNVKTATMQHAIYSTAKISNYSQMVINYENFCSDFIFAWGEALKKTMAGTPITPEKILITGTSVPNFRKRYDDLPIKKSTQTKKIGIVLSAEYWQSSNYALLKIAEYFLLEKGYEVNVLFHPTNIIDNYKSDLDFIGHFNILQSIPNLTDYMQDQDLILCHTTTLYFNALMNGKKTYRYVDEDFIDLIGLEDKFSDLQGLEQLILADSKIDSHSLNNILDYQFSKENLYSSTIKKLIND